MKSLVYLLYISFFLVYSSSVPAAIELLANLADQMQPGEWREIPNTKIPLYDPINLKEIEREFGGQPIYGTTGPRGVIDAWNSAAFDERGKKWYFFGGGHADYGGNEVYQFDLETLTWARLTKPAPLTGKNLAQNPKENTCQGPQYGPSPPHTYDGLVWNPTTDSMWLMSSRGFCKKGRVARLETLWEFKPESREWIEHPTPGLDPGLAMTAWNPKSGNIVLRTAEFGAAALGSVEIGPNAEIYRRNAQGFGQGSGNMSYYRPDGSMYLLHADGIYRQKLAGTTLPDTELVVKYPKEIRKHNLKLGGFAFHPSTEQFVIWTGGTSTWTWHPRTLQFRHIKNSTRGPASAHKRVFDKWIYIKEIGVFAGYNNHEQGVWLYKLNPGTPNINKKNTTTHSIPKSSNPSSKVSNSQISRIQARLDSMLLKYTDRHPDVISLKKELEKLKQGSLLSSTRSGEQESSLSILKSQPSQRIGKTDAHKGNEVFKSPLLEKYCSDVPGPCVVVHDKKQPNALKDGLAKIPLSGGTIVILPGTYLISKGNFLWMGNRTWLTIVGIPGADGKRPHIQGEENNAPNAIIPWNGTNGNLTLKNIEISGAGSDCIYSGSKRHSQKIKLSNVHIHHCGHHVWMHGWEPGNEWNDEVYAENSSFHHSGSTHVIYIDRIKKAEFKNIKAFAPKSLHAFKCVAIECNLIDSEISNGTLSGDWDHSTHWTAHQRLDGYLGSAPLSLVACQRGKMERNTIIFRYEKQRQTGGSVITRQPRHNIYGCDQPPYGSDKFHDPKFWTALKKKGLHLPEIIENPYIFGMNWINNTIKVLGKRGSGTTLRILNNSGTAPVKAVAPGETRLVYLPRPDGWIERSRDFLSGNCFQGVASKDELFASHPWGQMQENEIQPPTQVNRVLPIGLNNCR